MRKHFEHLWGGIDMNEKGFTLVEAMIAGALIALVAAGLYGTFLSGQRYFAAGISQLDSQRMSKYAIEKVGRRLRNAKSITLLSANGNNIEFAYEDQAVWTPFDNTDDRVSGFYFVNGDGDDNTFNNNRIMYDDDVNNPAVQAVQILSNVGRTNNMPIFSTVGAQPDRVRFRFTVFDTYAPDGYQGISVDTVVELRNYTMPYP